MASNPPGRCCTIGTLFEGDPKVQVIKVDDKIDAYLSKASAETAHKKCGILLLPDAIGIWQNSKLIADTFAVNGYSTLVMDIYNGDPIPLNRPGDFDLQQWIQKGSDGKNPHTSECVDPIVVAGLKALRDMGVDKIGAVGYCFGAKVFQMLLSDDADRGLAETDASIRPQYAIRHCKNEIKCAFVAHPSFVTEEELAAITRPLSIAAAETDAIFPAAMRHRSEEFLKQTGQPYQISLFSGVEHSFAVRGNFQVQVQKFAREQAMKQAVAWFDEFLAANLG